MKKIMKPCGLHCIRIQNLGVKFGEEEILKDVNLHIHCGTINAISGQNGAGKSTLVRAILNDIPHEGTIEFKDRENGRIQKLKIGYVPQNINIEKNTPVSVYDLIAGYNYMTPVCFWKSKKIRQEILEVLRVFEVEDLIDRQVCNLSGGQLQRVLLAMSIMDEPNLLLLDEPVSGIDQNGMELFYRTIKYLKENFDLSIILISHDLEYVKQYADQVILLDQTVKKAGTAKTVFASEEFAAVFASEELPSYINRKHKDSSDRKQV